MGGLSRQLKHRWEYRKVLTILVVLLLTILAVLSNKRKCCFARNADCSKLCIFKRKILLLRPGNDDAWRKQYCVITNALSTVPLENISNVINRWLYYNEHQQDVLILHDAKLSARCLAVYYSVCWLKNSGVLGGNFKIFLRSLVLRHERQNWTPSLTPVVCSGDDRIWQALYERDFGTIAATVCIINWSTAVRLTLQNRT